MYFSVITPEESLLRQAAHELAQSPYSEHQWLWNFFPSSEEQTRDFIYRRHELEQMPRFYVVSKRAPTAFSEAWQVQSRSYDPQLQEGQRLSFQLCANPVVTKKSDNGKSQRHDVVMEAKRQLLAERGLTADAKWSKWSDKESKPLLYEVAQKSSTDWLQTRASRHGFKVTEASVDAYQQFRAGKRDIRFSTVDFSGELLVTDPGVFRQALFCGIGHAKAFGCGLLIVKRVESE
jgi:CRISPR system Cascade subunit CasE